MWSGAELLVSDVKFSIATLMMVLLHQRTDCLTGSLNVSTSCYTSHTLDIHILKHCVLIFDDVMFEKLSEHISESLIFNSTSSILF